MATGFEQKETAKATHAVQITVPKGCCVFLRFKAGQSLKKIMGETGTHFRFFYNRRFTNADGTADIVIVSGSDESQVYEACKKIGLVLKNKLMRDRDLENAPHLLTWAITRIPLSIYKRSFGKGGIQAIAKESSMISCFIGRGTPNMGLVYISIFGVDYAVREADREITQKTLKAYDGHLDEDWGDNYVHPEDQHTVEEKKRGTEILFGENYKPFVSRIEKC